MKRKVFSTITLFIAACCLAFGQESGRFAYLADTHIAEGAASVGDLTACIEDINKDSTISFTIFAGDITEFGADREIKLAKSIIDRLEKPYYIVAGNHDAKWSESGCNTFASVFGYEHFEFDAFGIKFIGTNSGPNMRMAPALVPRESIVWLDSLVKAIPTYQPVIFVNHYPMDTSVLNWFEVVDILKESDIQLLMGGHWHNNTILNYEGIPGILGRSSMATGKKGPGYSIVTIADGKISIQEKVVGMEAKNPWFTLSMTEAVPYNMRNEAKSYPRPDYSCNEKYSSVKELWTIKETSDLGTGAAFSGDCAVYTTTQGAVKCVSLQDGSLKWSVSTGGKVFSTPAISKGMVVVGSTDNKIYCYSLKNGKLLWEHNCDKSVLASPAIYKDVVYIGSSDGRFRALKLKDGKMKWSYPDVKGFIESKAYVDDKQVVVGDWGNTLYSFDTKTGTLQWTWKTKGSRMYSPAAVWPVKANGRIFVTTPRRMTYAIEASSGNTVWSHRGGRESIGISPVGDRVYVKAMGDTVFCFSTQSGTPEVIWASDAEFGYEISPTPITTDSELVFVPTDKGDIIALKAADGSIVWRHKLSYALINYIQPIEGRKLLVTTMDGKVSLLSY